MQRYKNLAVFLIVLLIVISGGAVLYKKFHLSSTTRGGIKATNAENTNISDVKKIYSFFPENLSVDFERITQASSLEYTDSGVRLSSVGYISGKTSTELFESYQKYIIDNGFKADLSKSDKDIISGTKNGDTLTVGIIEQNGLRLIQLTYLDRK